MTRETARDAGASRVRLRLLRRRPTFAVSYLNMLSSAQLEMDAAKTKMAVLVPTFVPSVGVIRENTENTLFIALQDVENILNTR